MPSLLYLLGANSTHWWRSTRHYYMYTFIEKWIIIVYYEHNIVYASSRSDEVEVISDVYLYSRWLWWTLNVLHPFPHSPAGYESTWRAWRPADQVHCQFLISRSFHIHLLGHCNNFTPNAKQIRKLLWACEPIITSRLAFPPMTQWKIISSMTMLIAWRCSSSLPFCIVQPGFSWSKLVWSATQERTWDVLLYTRHPTNTQYNFSTTLLPQWFW